MSPYFFLHGVSPPNSMNEILAQQYPDQALPAEILKMREEVMTAHNDAVKYEREMFTEKDDAIMATKNPLLPGDHVVYRKWPRVKYTPPYHHQIFIITNINRRTVTLRPIFARKPQYINVHTRFVKKIDITDGVFSHLPPSLRNHLGGGIKIPSTSGAHNKPIGLRSRWPAQAPRETRRTRVTRATAPRAILSAGSPGSRHKLEMTQIDEEVNDKLNISGTELNTLDHLSEAVAQQSGAIPKLDIIEDLSESNTITSLGSSNISSNQTINSPSLVESSHHSTNSQPSISDHGNLEQTPPEKSKSKSLLGKIKRFLSPAPPPRFPSWSPGEREHGQLISRPQQPIPFMRPEANTPSPHFLGSIPPEAQIELTPPPLEPIPESQLTIPATESILRRSNSTRSGTQHSDYTYY